MGLNSVIIEGRIPFEIELKNGDTDEKKSFVGFTINVKRNYKPEGAEYYPDDDIYVKAFGPTAEFIARNFNKEDHIGIEGRLQRDEDRQDNDGDKIKGRLYVQVDRAHFVGSAKNGNGNGTEKAKTTSKKKTEDKGVPTLPKGKKGGKKKSIV